MQGREGAIHSWQAVLLTACTANNDCTAEVYSNVTYGGASWTIGAPPAVGTLEVSLFVRSYSNVVANSQPVYVTASTAAAPCTCSGTRTWVGVAPPTQGGGGSTAGESAGGGIHVDTKSITFLAPVIAASALVGIGLIGAAVWAGKVPQRLGFGGGAGSGAANGGHATGARLVPVGNKAAGGAVAGAAAGGAAAAVAHTGASKSAAGPGSERKAAPATSNGNGSIASRRVGAARVPPLTETSGTAPSTAATPAANGVGAHGVSATPVGDRRV
jgi:hypothetical protein